mmetsp:Transcript_40806/g.87036  ORF Transcript_40806/g.87036 Transcript_40806/m.87036 type:complete len:202 (-) Transcript_40806:88-693(-)
MSCVSLNLPAQERSLRPTSTREPSTCPSHARMSVSSSSARSSSMPRALFLLANSSRAAGTAMNCTRARQLARAEAGAKPSGLMRTSCDTAGPPSQRSTESIACSKGECAGLAEGISERKPLSPSRSLKTRVDLPKTSERPGARRWGLRGLSGLPEMKVPWADPRSSTTTEPEAETVTVACSREMEAWVSTMSASPACRPTL